MPVNIVRNWQNNNILSHLKIYVLIRPELYLGGIIIVLSIRSYTRIIPI